MLVGAGVEPERNLIANSLLLLLDREGDNGPSMQIEDALDHVLLNNPPIANYATHFPVQDVDLGGVVVQANSPWSSVSPVPTATRRSPRRARPTAEAPTSPGARARTPARPRARPRSSRSRPSS